MICQIVGLNHEAGSRSFLYTNMSGAGDLPPDPGKKNWKKVIMRVLAIIIPLSLLGSLDITNLIENALVLKGQYEHSSSPTPSPAAMDQQTVHEQMIEEMLEEIRKGNKTGVWEFVEEGEGGRPHLNPSAEKMLLDLTNRMNNYEQYVITAKTDGWYPCRGCEPPAYTKSIIDQKWFWTYLQIKPRDYKGIYLKKGMVLKYGVKAPGDKRYPLIFKYLCNCKIQTELTGTETEMKLAEFEKSMRYIYRPENWSRPPAQRLTSPPWQKGFR